MFYSILSCPTLSSLILSYPILSYPIFSHLILSYPILPYSILLYPILSYHILPTNLTHSLAHSLTLHKILVNHLIRFIFFSDSYLPFMISVTKPRKNSLPTLPRMTYQRKYATLYRKFKTLLTSVAHDEITKRNTIRPND